MTMAQLLIKSALPALHDWNFGEQSSGPASEFDARTRFKASVLRFAAVAGMIVGVLPTEVYTCICICIYIYMRVCVNRYITYTTHHEFILHTIC